MAESLRFRLARLSELADGTVRSFAAGEFLKVALARVGSRVYAFEDRCTHDDGELASGSLCGETQIECPRHGARFDMASGKAVRMPAVIGIQVYPVEIIK